MSIKSALLSVPWIYSLNAALKSRATKRLYRRTMAHYGGMPTRHRLPALKCLSASKEKCNIFFVGTDEMQDRSGILQALARLGRLQWFTRADGSYGQNDPRPEALRRRANADRLWALVSEQASAGRPPDILIAQTWPTLMDPMVLDRIRAQYGTFVVSLSMDDRHQFWGRRLQGSWSGTRGLIGHVDLALTAAAECVEWYEKEGCPSLFFPEASDPDIFHPMPQLPKIYDVCFVGARYGIRNDLVVALKAAGIGVAAYGSGWEGGRITTEDVPKLFAQSKIVLGVGTIGHCRDFYALKMRDFDGPMSGSLYLTHANPDLATLFEFDREIVVYSSIGDCVNKVRHHLADATTRERIAQAGCARAVKDHTWSRRFDEIFSRLRRPSQPSNEGQTR